jgi:integrase/recombinase XerC
MASVFKRKDEKKWTAQWKGADGRFTERSTGTTDKGHAHRMARHWQDQDQLRREGKIDPAQERLAQEHARSISEHLADFTKHKSAKGTTEKCVSMTEGRIRAVIDEAKAKHLADLTPTSVQAAVRAIRDRRKLSAQTAAHHVSACKAFTRWAFNDGRASGDPLASLTVPTTKDSDRKRVRRELDAEELARLVAEAERSRSVTFTKSSRHGPDKELRTVSATLSAPDRAWAYRIAAATGFRAAEVCALTPECFNLDTNPPTISLAGASTKNGSDAVQPIHADTADVLRPWLEHKPAAVPVCRVPEDRLGLCVRVDLDAARARWIAEATNDTERKRRDGSDFLRSTDSAGRVADFHALRAGYISAVVGSGTDLKSAMTLARHSDPKLTLRTYARPRLHALSAALPKPIGSVGRTAAKSERMRATGTDGAIGSNRDSAPSREKTTPEGPHQSPQTRHDSDLTRAARCDDVERRENDADSTKPLCFKGPNDSVRAGAERDENATDWIRTNDLRFRKPPLYPAELRPHEEL